MPNISKVKKDLNKALQLGLDALKSDPKNAGIIEIVGRAYINLEEFDKALSVFTSISLEEASVTTLGYMATMYIEMDEYEKSVQAYTALTRKATGYVVEDTIVEQCGRAFAKRKR
jgi:tetratricopeptide (TPR) repeat protein